MAQYQIDEIQVQEHESGPEVLLWLALATASVTLAKSVVDLIAVIVKARSEGISRGDRPADPIEVIVRELDSSGEPREERVMRFSQGDPVSHELLGKFLNNAVTRTSGPASVQRKESPNRKASTNPDKPKQRRARHD